MNKIARILWLMVCSAMLSACIKVELKDERTIPNLYEIALVTHTPPVRRTGQPTATNPPASATQVPTLTATLTPMPTSTTTAIPSATSLSPTPILFGTVRFNAWCRAGPGFAYSGVLLLSTGEAVNLVGANADASWFWIQPSAGALQCWASTLVISLPEPLPLIPVITASSFPAANLPFQSTPVPTQRSRPRPPRPTTSATEPPNPYPYPVP